MEGWLTWFNKVGAVCEVMGDGVVDKVGAVCEVMGDGVVDKVGVVFGVLI